MPDKDEKEKSAAAAPSGGNETAAASPAAGASPANHSGSPETTQGGSHNSRGHRRKHHHHSQQHHHFVTGDITVPLSHDEQSFEARQQTLLVEIEKNMEVEVKKKKDNFEKEVERMKEDFLHLYPTDKPWGSEDYINDPLVIRRRGSVDVLDTKKLKTMFFEQPGFGRRFKLMYDVQDFFPGSVSVACEGDTIVVRAKKKEEDSSGNLIEREYSRKIEKPLDVDPDKLKSYLTSDRVLALEAPLPPRSSSIRKSLASPSHSARSYTSSRSRSPSYSPHTPQPAGSSDNRLNLPQFHGPDDERKLFLMVDVGTVFAPRDITVQILNTSRLIIKGKHEEKTSDLFSKSRYLKEFDLSEKIEPFSVRTGCLENGLLLIGGLCKNKTSQKKIKLVTLHSLIKDIYDDDDISELPPSNVLDLASFPPTALPQK